MIAVCITSYFIRNSIVAFFIAAVVLGVWLRSHRTKENAEHFGCVMHFFFFRGHGRTAARRHRLPRPHPPRRTQRLPHVGYITLSLPEEPYPFCGAWVETFQKFMPKYWFDALESPTVPNRLRQTPLNVEKLIEGLSDETINRTPPDGSWATRNVLRHLEDAQGMLISRLDLFQKEEHPDLEA